MEQVRTFLFERSRFTWDQAVKFVEKKGHKVAGYRIGKRFISIHPSQVECKGVVRIKQLRKGVKAVVVTR